MRKTCILFSNILLVLSFIPQVTFAHTISQHLAELYGQTYLPVYIVAKILPFIGLGMLAFNQGKSSIPFKNHWILFMGISLGAILSFLNETLDFIFMTNNVGIVISGLLLIIITTPNKQIIQLILVVAGVTLGYEYGINISHSMEFKWLFSSILAAGLTLFMVLSRIQFFRVGVRSMIRISAGLLLVIAGLIVILMS